MKKYLFGFFAVLFALPAFGQTTHPGCQGDNLSKPKSALCKYISDLAKTNKLTGTDLSAVLDASIECELLTCSIEADGKYYECTFTGIGSRCKYRPLTTDSDTSTSTPDTTPASTVTDSANSSASATYLITGTVYDSDNTPMPGATVKIVKPDNQKLNNSDYTYTNNDGKFSINVPNDVTELEISFAFYKTKNVPISKTDNSITVTLEAETENLPAAISIACGPEQLKKLHAKKAEPRTDKDNGCYPTECESDRYKLVGTGNTAQCVDQVGKECTATDANVSKSKYVWENNTLKCEIKKCNKGYLPNDAGTACDVSEGPCTDAQIQQIEHATAGELKRGVCHATECDAGYEAPRGKCIAISGNCSPMPENATSAHREYDSTAGVEVCIIDACRDGYRISNDKKSCIEPTLSQADAQKQIAELQENADAMREREQSLANRMVGGASMGAMGNWRNAGCIRTGRTKC